MSCQASYISFPLNPYFSGPRVTHPVITEICERRLSMTVRHPSKHVAKRADKYKRNAHCQMKIVTMTSECIFVDICIFDFNLD